MLVTTYCDHHAVVFSDSTTASKKRHQEDDHTNNDEKHGSWKKFISQEIQIRRVQSLNNSCRDDERNARNLRWEKVTKKGNKKIINVVYIIRGWLPQKTARKHTRIVLSQAQFTTENPWHKIQ